MVAVDHRAEAHGLRCGLGLADARAAVPDLLVAEADQAADGALLEAVADWCDRYTPLVALDPPDGLFLDISGCAHLFAGAGAGAGDDGEAALRADLLSRLHAQGFAARAAIASTAGAAWAAARFGGADIIAPGGEREALAPLPAAALRLAADERLLLDRFGLKRIGQLLDQPRAPLAARCGPSLLRRLDQALGEEDEALSPRRPAPVLSAERRFAEPLGDGAAVLAVLASLAGALRPALERQGTGARRLEAALFRVDGGVLRVGLGTAAPLRAPERIAALFSERFAALGDRLDPGFGIDLVRLSVEAAEPLPLRQADFSGNGAAGADLEDLVDRLGARLGTARVRRFLPVDSHIPELAASARPCAALAGAAVSWPEADQAETMPPHRPLRLFARAEPVEVLAEVPEGPPLRFRWRRVVCDVARAEGPERIAPEWWRADDGALTRDYWRVEDAAGRRYWLYRDGLYGRETERPAWYLHGLFA